MALAVSNQQSRDAALLRATAELFVLETAHDRDEIHRFEELATHFLGKVGAADRAFVAERLSRSPDAPASVLRLLGKDLPEVASPILKRSPALAEFDLLAIMAATGYSHHRLIASRSDLSPTVVSALRRTGDEEVLRRLGAYPAVTAELPPEPELKSTRRPKPEATAASPLPTSPTPASAEIAPAPASPPEAVEASPAAIKPEAREVFAAARAMAASLGGDFARIPAKAKTAAADPAPPVSAPNLAEDIGSQPAIAAEAEAPPLAAGPALPAVPPQPATPNEAPAVADSLPGPATFLELDRAGRLAALAALDTAKATPSRHSAAIGADAVFRLALARARVSATIRQKQRQALIDALAEGLRLPPEGIAALVDDPSGEPLVVLLSAIGLSEVETQQVLLFANPPIAEAVANFARLAALFAHTGKPAADRLVKAWQEAGRSIEAHPPTASRAHPGFADMPLRREGRAAAAAAPGETRSSSLRSA